MSSKNVGRVYFDIETDGLLDQITKVHCLSLWTKNTKDPQLFVGDEKIDHALDILDAAEELVGHNIQGFDIPALTKIYGWMPNLKTKITDTLVMSRFAFPHIDLLDFKASRGRKNPIPKGGHGPHSLNAWGHRLKFHKDTFHEDTDWREYSPEMGVYCVQDVRLNRKVFLKIKKYLSNKILDLPYLPVSALETEHLFSQCCDRQMEVGIHFDVQQAAILYADLVKKRTQLTAKLQEVIPGTTQEMRSPQYYVDPETNKKYTLKKEAPAKLRPKLVRGPNKIKHTPFNPGSRQQIAEFLSTTYGWKPKKDELTDTGLAKIDEDILKALKYKEAPLLTEYLLVQKRLSQLAEGKTAWMKHEVAGKIYGRILHIGTDTHRCAHNKPNLGQVPSVRVPYGKRCRELFLPPPGYKLVGCDLSQLELRVMAHFLEPFDDGYYIKQVLEGDIHTTNQVAAGLPDRDKAKTFIYALIYGAGDEKLGTIVGGSKKEGKILRARFFRKLPAFKLFIENMKEQARKGFINAIDGRPIPVESLHTAVNRLFQSSGAIIGKYWVNLLHGKYAEYNLGMTFLDCAKQLLYVHDEVQWGVIPEQAEEFGKFAVACAKQAGEILEMKIPLDAEFKIGNNWKETH